MTNDSDRFNRLGPSGAGTETDQIDRLSIHGNRLLEPSFHADLRRAELHAQKSVHALFLKLILPRLVSVVRSLFAWTQLGSRGNFVVLVTFCSGLAVVYKNMSTSDTGASLLFGGAALVVSGLALGLFLLYPSDSRLDTLIRSTHQKLRDANSFYVSRRQQRTIYAEMAQAERDRRTELQRKRQQDEIERSERIRKEAESLRNVEVQRITSLYFQNRDRLVSLSGRQFEDFVARLYDSFGWSVRQTPYSNDGGVDLFVSGDGKTFPVQCKCYGGKVGVRHVREFFAAMYEVNAAEGFFVTTSAFTRAAVNFAKNHKIELVCGTDLMLSAQKAFPNTDSDLSLRVMCLQCGEIVRFPLTKEVSQKECQRGHGVTNTLILYSVFGKMLCERCGRELCRRTGRRGDFWGCTGYPNCKHTESIE